MNKIYKVSLFMMLMSVSLVFAQSSAKEKFFADYEKLITEAREQNGEVLAPTKFKEAVELFDEANQAYEEKESAKSIREILDESAVKIREALQIIKNARKYLKPGIEARDAAISADAALYATQAWEDASEKFADAVANIEDGDFEDAEDDDKDAVQLFSQAELIAIKNSILNDARENIALAKDAGADAYAYHTFTDAQNLLAETERLLDSDRYAREEAIKKANEAVYQAKHAAYLARTVKALSQKEENWEKLILKFEEILSDMGGLFNYNPAFDQGFDKSVKTISAYIKSLKEEKKQLIARNNALQEELDKTRESEANVSAELMKKRKREKKIENIKSLFAPDEASVIYEGDNLIIRLFGLNFPSGKDIIQPEYFSLLTKVQEALREFPDSHFTIEGHTDDRGNNNKNKILSEKRASSVRQYLLANMDIPEEQISRVGYGESRPIASNKTKEGREKNRRIDIVIAIQDDGK